MIVISDKSGQLGNRIIVFASFIAIACEQNLTVANPSFEEYSDYFDSCKNYLIPGYPKAYFKTSKKYLRRFSYRLAYLVARILHRLKFNSRYLGYIYLDSNERFNLQTKHKLLEKTFCLVQGWGFQPGQLLSKHRERICAFFQPGHEYNLRITEFISQAKTGNRLLIGIHIRQGDYKNFEGGKYFFETDSYIRLISHLNQQFFTELNQKPRFVIFSNQSLKQEVFHLLDGIDFIFGPGHELLDMYCLSACNYICGPPSTYTIWASFYGNAPLFMFREPGKKISPSEFLVWKPD